MLTWETTNNSKKKNEEFASKFKEVLKAGEELRKERATDYQKQTKAQVELKAWNKNLIPA